MGLEREIKVKATVNNPEGSYGPGKVECKTVNGEVLIDTIRKNIMSVTRNDTGIFDVVMKKEVEWVTGHNPSNALAEALTSDQANLNRLMAESFAVATVSKFYENSESGIPENITAAEHEIVGEIAFRLAKNPWHNAEKFKKLNLHTDITKSLDWVSQNAGENKKSYSWFMIPMGGVMVACNPVIASTPAAEVAPLPSSAVENPTDTNVVVTSPTPEAQVTPTVIHLENAGGPYTAEQEALNNSELAKKEKDTLELWVNNYWTAPEFKNRPFEKNSKDLHIISVYDDLQNPTEVKVLLQVTGDYNGRTFTVPFGANGPAEFPPEVEGDYIEEGYGPLELTAGNENWRLSVENGIFVRRDKSSNEVMEKLDYVTRQWVEAETRINMEMLHKFPSSYEYLVEHPNEFVQAPSDKAERVRWVKEVLTPTLGTVVHEREVTINLDRLSESDGYISRAKDYMKGTQTLLPIMFVYFIDQGVYYPVPIFNVQIRDYTPGMTNITMAPILADIPRIQEEDILGRLYRGENISGIEIYIEPCVNAIVSSFIEPEFVKNFDVNDPNGFPLFSSGRIEMLQR